MRMSFASSFLILILSAASCICSEDGVSPATNAIDLFFNNNVHRNLSIADHPYQVSLQYSFYGHICGGVILSEQWILSSARCVSNFDPNLLSILTGTVALDDEINGVRRSVARVVIYPGYDGSRLPDGDVALLELSEALQFSENIKAVNLPPANFTSSSSVLECTVTGWGAAEYLGDVPLDMRSQTLITVRIDLCENTFSILNITLPAGMTLCARDGTGSGLGPCTGEWGSPLICNDESSENNLLLLGLVSADPLPCSQFAGFGIPFLFSRVSFYIDWINSFMTSSNANKYSFE